MIVAVIVTIVMISRAWYYSFVHIVMLTFMSLHICVYYFLVYALKYIFCIHI